MSHKQGINLSTSTNNKLLSLIGMMVVGIVVQYRKMGKI